MRPEGLTFRLARRPLCALLAFRLVEGLLQHLFCMSRDTHTKSGREIASYLDKGVARLFWNACD